MTLNELMNEIEAKQAELVEMNERLAQYNRNADNKGCRTRMEILDEMRKVMEDIESLTNKVMNY